MIAEEQGEMISEFDLELLHLLKHLPGGRTAVKEIPEQDDSVFLFGHQLLKQVFKRLYASVDVADHQISHCLSPIFILQGRHFPIPVRMQVPLPFLYHILPRLKGEFEISHVI